MNRKILWGVIGFAQIVGALGFASGSPHGNPLGLLFGFIFLFPGSLLCWPILDKLAILTTGFPVIITAVVVNVALWLAFAFSTARIRGRKSH
jgi:hypothetical protein